VELALGVNYRFHAGAKLAVFTWTGCRLRLQGACKVCYVATETPMQAYLNLHLALDGLRREQAASNSATSDSYGPRVILVGPEDCGKTTLGRILVSYAHKMGWMPLYVDLDPRDAS
jgi:polyribonucleotide 5'-hydroxyl-kinase